MTDSTKITGADALAYGSDVEDSANRTPKSTLSVSGEEVVVTAGKTNADIFRNGVMGSTEWESVSRRGGTPDLQDPDLRVPDSAPAGQQGYAPWDDPELLAPLKAAVVERLQDRLAEIQQQRQELRAGGQPQGGSRRGAAQRGLRGRVQLNLDADRTRTRGNKVARGFLSAGIFAATAGGAVGGGVLGGMVTGAAVGLAATSWTGPGAIVGAVVGGLIGGLSTGYLGKKLIEWASSTPQANHVEKATDRLQDMMHRDFTPVERGHLENHVTDAQWRTLLHIPSSKTPFRTMRAALGQAKAGYRQRIREALVLHVAQRGLRIKEQYQAADQYKQRLIAAANESEEAFKTCYNEAVGETFFPRPRRLQLWGNFNLNLREFDHKINNLIAENVAAPDRDKKVFELVLVEAAKREAASGRRVAPDRLKQAVADHVAKHGWSEALVAAVSDLARKRDNKDLVREINNRVGERILPRQRRDALRDDLNLELPPDIDDKITRLVVANPQARDLDAQVKALMIAEAGELADKRADAQLVGPNIFPQQARDNLRRDLGLADGPLPRDIDDKINALVAENREAADLEKQVSKLLVEEAAKEALRLGQTSPERIRVQRAEQRAANAIAAHEARYTRDAALFLRDNHAGASQLKQILRKRDAGYAGQTINDVKEQVATGPLASLRPEHVGNKSAEQLQEQARAAIANLDRTMTAIIGGKEDDEIERAVQVVPRELRNLLSGMEQAAEDNANPNAQGNPKDFAWAAKMNCFVLRNFNANLSAAAKSALPEGVWGKDQYEPDERGNLQYNSALVMSVLNPTERDSIMTARDQPAWQAAQETVKQARDAWREPARKFIEALGSGHVR